MDLFFRLGVFIDREKEKRKKKNYKGNDGDSDEYMKEKFVFSI